MATRVCGEPIEINFDPWKTEDPLIRRIFNDNVARALWLMVKSSHHVYGGFNEWCLRKANVIYHNWPETSEQLHKLIHDKHWLCRPDQPPYLENNWEESKEWLERLLLALRHTKLIRFKFKGKEDYPEET